MQNNTPPPLPPLKDTDLEAHPLSNMALLFLWLGAGVAKVGAIATTVVALAQTPQLLSADGLVAFLPGAVAAGCFHKVGLEASSPLDADKVVSEMVLVSGTFAVLGAVGLFIEVLLT